MKRHNAITAICTLVAGLGWASVANPIPLIVLDQDSNTLYEIDTDNLGNPRTIGVIERGTDLVELVRFSNDLLLTFDRDANEMIAVRRLDASVAYSVTLDQDIPEQPRGFDVMPHNGELRGIFSSVELRSIHPGSGATIPLGLVIDANTFEAPRTIEALTFGPDGMPYVVGSPGSPDSDPPFPPSTTLYALYFGYGVWPAEAIGEMPVPDIDTLTFAPDGFLYGADTVPGQSADLYRIDPATASVVNLGDTGVVSLSGIASAGVGMAADIASLSDGTAGGGDVGNLWWNEYQGNRLTCIDGSTGSTLFNEDAGTSDVSPGTLATLPDLTSDDVTEVALLGVDSVTGKSTAFVLDGMSGLTLTTIPYSSSYYPVDLMSIPSAGISGAGLGVLGVRADGRVLLMVRNPMSGALISTVPFTQKYRPFASAVLADMDNSGADEVVVLGVDDLGRLRAPVKDSVSGIRQSLVYFNRNYSPTDFIGLPDVYPDGSPEIAVLGVSTVEGTVRVFIKEAATAQKVGDFSYEADGTPIALVYVPDSGGTSSIGVLGRRSDGAIRLQLRQVPTGLEQPDVFFDEQYFPRDVVVVEDTNGNGADEVAVLGSSANQKRLEMVDSQTGERIFSRYVQ